MTEESEDLKNEQPADLRYTRTEADFSFEVGKFSARLRTSGGIEDRSWVSFLVACAAAGAAALGTVVLLHSSEEGQGWVAVGITFAVAIATLAFASWFLGRLRGKGVR